jgi:hypothetical protein
MTKQGEAVFSMVKPSESMKTLAALAEDVFTLVERFTGNEPVVTMTSYQFLVRLLKEQCILERVDTHTTQVSVKANKDVSSDSLQNPSDPDVGYNGYKGQGYQVQVAESYGTSEDSETLNLITGVIVEPAHKRDAHALIPLIETTAELGLKPKEALADTLYGGVENCRKAEALGVEIVSPVKGAGPNASSLTEFTMNSANEVILCPAGCAPECTERQNDKYTAFFSKRTCRGCLRKKTCPTKPRKRGRSLRYDDKAIRLARRRVYEESSEFRERYLRVRGMSAVNFAAYLKAAGINIIRAAAFRNRETERKLTPTGIFSRLSCAVKERSLRIFEAVRRPGNFCLSDTWFAALYAA